MNPASESFEGPPAKSFEGPPAKSFEGPPAKSFEGPPARPGNLKRSPVNLNTSLRVPQSGPAAVPASADQTDPHPAALPGRPPASDAVPAAAPSWRLAALTGSLPRWRDAAGKVTDQLPLLSYPARKALAVALQTLDDLSADSEGRLSLKQRFGRTALSFLPVVRKWKEIGDLRSVYQHAKESGDPAALEGAREKASLLLGKLGFDAITAGRGEFARELVVHRRLHHLKNWPLVRHIPGVDKLPTIDPVEAIAAAVQWGRGQADVVDLVFGTKPGDLV